MTNAPLAAIPGIDIPQFIHQGEQAGGGWWAAVVVLILLIGGGWLLRYFIGRVEALIVDLKKSHDDQTSLLVGVVKENTKAFSEHSTSFSQLRASIEARLSIRGGQNG